MTLESIYALVGWYLMNCLSLQKVVVLCSPYSIIELIDSELEKKNMPLESSIHALVG
jgi:hypothetical protein